MEVSISRIHFPVTTLGPGQRIGIWFQGCSIRCPGCISVDTWDAGAGAVAVQEAIASIGVHAGIADGLTVSGGEPFDQADALAAVLREWRRMAKRSVLVFTGYDFPQISPWLAKHAGLVDAIVTGPYRRNLPQTLALRGSDNQELHILSPLGEPFRAYARTRRPEDRRLDVMFDEDGGAWFAGIPEPNDFVRFRRALAAAGHTSAMAKTEVTQG